MADQTIDVSVFPMPADPTKPMFDHRDVKRVLCAIRGKSRMTYATYRVWRKWAYVTHRGRYSYFDVIRLTAVAQHLAHGGVFNDFAFAVHMLGLSVEHEQYAANYQ